MNVSEGWFVWGFALALSAASAGLMYSHVRTWRCCRKEAAESADYDFRRRQFRRRMQCSGLLGVLGVALVVGQGITSPPWDPIVPLFFWGAMLLGVLWLGLLAIADLVATKYHFSRLRDLNRIQQAQWEVQLHYARQSRSNGKPNSED